MYDLLLKGAQVVDPAQGINGVRDVAVNDGRIAAVEESIAGSEATKVIPLSGKIVTTGLIDLHCHAANGFIPSGVTADEIGLDSGVTLLCDGGTAGPGNFYTFRRFIMERARTDMMCFLNFGKAGFVILPEIRYEHDFDQELTRIVAQDNRDVIRGIKIRLTEPLASGIGIKAVEKAKKLAVELGLPLVFHIGEPRDRVAGEIMDDFTRASVRLLDKGDVISHFMTWEAGGLILPDGTVYPELLEARKRGVILDSCHGFNHFSLSVARAALEQGILPTVISTDMTTGSVSTVQSLVVTMSKFIGLGLTVDQVIEMTTVNPAKALGEESRRGSLKPGMPANITVMEIVKGDYLFADGNGRGSMRGNRLLEPRLVLKAGVERPCHSHYSIPPVFNTIARPDKKQTKWTPGW
jgi:dihydroorotase